MSTQPARGKTTPASNNGSFTTYVHGVSDVDLGEENAPVGVVSHTCSQCGNDYADGTTRCGTCGHVDLVEAPETDYATLVDTDPRHAAHLAYASTDSAVLDALAEALPEDSTAPAHVAIRNAIMTNPTTPRDAKKHILGVAPAEEAIAYLQDPNIIDADLIKNWLVDLPAPDRVEALACHPETDASTLGLVYADASGRSYNLARAYAESRLRNGIYGGTDLSEHSEEEVRHLYASHAHGVTHSETLHKIAEGDDPHLAAAVFLNKKAPTGTRVVAALNGMGSMEDHEQVREFFSTHPEVPAYSGLVVADIDKHGYHYATAAIASHPALPHQQQIALNLLTDPTKSGRDSGGNDIRLRLASNPGVDLNVLATTLVDGNFREKDAAWRNTATHRPEALPLLERLAADKDFYSTLTEPETWEFDRVLSDARWKAQQS
jgi:hypothetical protein